VERRSSQQGKERDVSRSWEYKTFDLNSRKSEIAALDELGHEGWEAVAMVSSWGIGWRWVHPIVLLKRELPDT
jgi:hypothetical protein